MNKENVILKTILHFAKENDIEITADQAWELAKVIVKFNIKKKPSGQ